MTFNTGNPIGSTDARDLSDNAENFDKALGTLSPTWTDRLGRKRDSFEGRLAKGSFYRVGTFSAGYTLTNMRQTLEYNGHEYSWAGTFPKVVAAGATPETSGGIGAGAWVDRSGNSLKSDLEAGGLTIAQLSDPYTSIIKHSLSLGSTVHLSDIIDAQPYYLSQYGFPTGGDDLTLLQALLDNISSSGGGYIVSDTKSDILLSDHIKVKDNLIIEWRGTGFWKLTGNSTQGSTLLISRGDKTLSPVNNVTLLNPQVDGGGFGYPTGATYGNNGVAGTRCNNVFIFGGEVKNCFCGAVPYSSGGTGLNFESGANNVFASGITFRNCTRVCGVSGAYNIVAPNDYRTFTGINYSDFTAYDCGSIFTSHMPVSDPVASVEVCVATVNGIEAYRCGRLGLAGYEKEFGAITVDRVSNLSIKNINIYNTSGYGAILSVVQMFRGEANSFENINLYGSCDYLVAHTRPTNAIASLFTTAGNFRRNTYDIRCYGDVAIPLKIDTTYTSGMVGNEYHFCTVSVTGLLIDSNATVLANTSYVEFKDLQTGKRIDGVIEQVRQKNAYPSVNFSTQGTYRVNTVTMTYGSNSDTFLFDGVLHFNANGTVRMTVKTNTVLMVLPTYADNTAAASGGLAAGDLYKTSTGVVMCRY